jgi:hypothetical protein
MSKITRTHIVFLIFISLAVLSFGGYVLTGTWIKKFGFTVIPSEEGEFISPKYSILGEQPVPADLTETNIRNSWMVAVALKASGIDVTAREINKSLADSGFYAENGDIYWKRLNKAIPQSSFFFKQIFTGSTLVTELNGGRLPLVKVKNRKTKNIEKDSFRWLMLIGYKKKDFLVIDPLRLPDIKPVPLSPYGKIYGYRALYRTMEM